MQPPAHNRNYYLHEPSGIWCADITDHLNFNLGNAVKYVFRAGKKDEEVECLRKAAWYLRRQASVGPVEEVSSKDLCKKVLEHEIKANGSVPMKIVLLTVFLKATCNQLTSSAMILDAYSDGIEDTVNEGTDRSYLDHDSEIENFWNVAHLGVVDASELRRFWKMGHHKALEIPYP